MAEVPVVQIGAGRRGASGPVSQAVPAAAGGGISQAARSVAANLVAAARQDAIDRDLIVSVTAEGDFARRASEAAAGLDPMAPDYSERLQETYDGLRSELVEGTSFSTPEVAADFAERTQRISNAAILSAMADRRRHLAVEAERVRGEAEDRTLASIRSDPGAFDAALSAFQEQAGRLNGGIRPERLPALNERFADAAVVAKAEGLAMRGQIKAANAFLDAQQGALSPEHFRAAKNRLRQIDAEKREDHLRGSQRAVADIEIGIAEAAAAEDFQGLAAMRGRVDAADRAGLFTNREGVRADLIRGIEAARHSVANRNRERQDVAAAIAAGAPLLNQHQADIAWGIQNGDLTTKASSAEFADRLVRFADQHGFVPSGIKALSAKGEATADPSTVAAAAQVYASVSDVAPGVDVGAGERVKAVAGYARLYGVPYLDAAKKIVAATPDPQQFSVREKALAELLKDFVAAREVSALDLGGGALTNELAASDYDRALRLQYKMHGDLRLAREQAARHVKERFGTTRVGGGETRLAEPEEGGGGGTTGRISRVVEMPPERYLPGLIQDKMSPDDKAAVIDDLVEVALKGRVALPDTRPPDVPKWDLMATETTRRDAADGKPPRYLVRVYDSYGNPVPVGVFQMPASVDELKASPTFEKAIAVQRSDAERARRIQKMLDISREWEGSVNPLSPWLMPPGRF